ncbi:MAG TPA: AMP-binding protein [Chitinispirillaceae bacterium]|nr:AMP-binding protein [Chitinispirillaceae bacterium]
MKNKSDSLQSLFDSLKHHGPETALIQFSKSSTITRLSFSILNSKTASVARGLISSGISSGERIALMANPSIDAVIAALGIIRTGATLVPIDHQINGKSLIHILKDSSPRLLIADDEVMEKIKETDLKNKPELINLSNVSLLSKEDVVLPDLKPEDIAILFYTSGTTGAPKGVPQNNRAISYQFAAVNEAHIIRKNDRILLPLPFHHVYPLVIGLLTALFLGLTIILPYSVTGPQLIRAIKEGDATVIIGVPRLYQALYDGILRSIKTQKGSGALLAHLALNLSTFIWKHTRIRAGVVLLKPVRNKIGSHLRLLASGGAALPESLFNGLAVLGWQISVGYGLTETAPLLTLSSPARTVPASAGRAVIGVDLRIDKTMPHNKNSNIGEIQARGPGVFQGYRNLQKETAEMFTKDGWLRTGDSGYLNKNGDLFITGRLSTLIITDSGENIQPDEVEAWYEKSPYISEAGVLKADHKLTAVIIPDFQVISESGMSVPEAVRWAVNEQNRSLPSYKRITEYVMTREKIPRTRLGKIRRHLLYDHYIKAKTLTDHKHGQYKPQSIASMSVKDRNLLLHPVANQVWERLVHYYPDYSLTLDTSPQLDLGIDSLGWLEITLDIRDRTGIEIDEQAIRKIETIRDLITITVSKKEAGIFSHHEDPFINPVSLLDANQKKYLRPKGGFLELISAALYCLNWIFMHTIFKISVHGLKNVLTRQQIIITPNHLSYIDSFVIAAVLPYPFLRRCSWAGAMEVAFRNPVFSFVSRLAGAVPITHSMSAMGDMAISAAVLNQKRNYIWYPEGRLGHGNGFLPFHRGLGFLLQHHPVMIVPVIIEGTQRALPVGEAMIHPCRIDVTFGMPVTTAELEKRVEKGRLSEEQKIVEGLRVVMEELRQD